MNKTFKQFVSEKIVPYNYNRDQVKTAILHVGIGNFHRAHEQFYTNLLLEHEDQQDFGVCGVGLLPSDEKLVNVLQEQNGNYTLTLCGNDFKQGYNVGSLKEVIWGIKEPQKVIDKIADPFTKIITLTITEGGYLIDGETKKFLIENDDIQHDLKNLDKPKTVFGFVAAGLRKRMKNGDKGLTILSCDNLQHNGNTTKLAFTSFIEAQDKELSQWIKTNVTFPNSMVDRITPATKPEDISWLNKLNEADDKAPVFCEDFIQWVIEDNFVSDKPAWDRVGAEFTKDVTAYENMKLSLLNASHTLLSYPSFLLGYRKVDEAMGNQLILQFVKEFMDVDITPYVPAPENINLTEYKETLINRFSNKTVSDQVSRLCFDGMSKFPVYIMPNLEKMVSDKKDLTRLAFLIASYRHYLKYKKDDKGETFDIAEPWLTDSEKKYIDSNEPKDFLDFKPFRGSLLKSSENFTSQYVDYCNKIKDLGVEKVLKSIL